MKSILSFILCVSIFFSQGNGHFIETSEPLNKDQKSYPVWVMNLSGGYLIHENIDIPRPISYKDNLVLTGELSRYLFQGIYVVASATVSPTRVSSQVIGDNLENKEVIRDYTYFTPNLGFRYYFRKNQEMNDPWFTSFALGRNMFISNTSNWGRFSALMEFGKITDYKFLGANVYWALSGHFYEGTGYRPFIDNNTGRYYDVTPDYVMHMSFKLNIGFHFNLTDEVIKL